MAKQLFGTDGIRGIAGEYPLDPLTAHALGAALGAWARHHSETPEVVIGMDTRESGSWLAEQVAGGLAREGVGVRFAGVVTTPGVAYLTRTEDFVAGVILAVLGELDADTLVRTAMHTAEEPLDDFASDHAEPAVLCERCWIETHDKWIMVENVDNPTFSEDT